MIQPLNQLLFDRQAFNLHAQNEKDNCMLQKDHFHWVHTVHCGGLKMLAYFHLDQRSESWNLPPSPSGLLLFYLKQRSHLDLD